MTNMYNDEKVIVSFSTRRKLDMTSQGANMVANCLLGRNKVSGVEPNLYTLFLTEKTFYAEYSRTSLHGDKPIKVTKLNIPIEDIKKAELMEKDGELYLYMLSDWGKEYFFSIENDEIKEQAELLIKNITR